MIVRYAAEGGTGKLDPATAAHANESAPGRRRAPARRLVGLFVKSVIDTAPRSSALRRRRQAADGAGLQARERWTGGGTMHALAPARQAGGAELLGVVVRTRARTRRRCCRSCRSSTADQGMTVSASTPRTTSATPALSPAATTSPIRWCTPAALDLSHRWGLAGYPETFIIDAGGHVVHHFPGEVSGRRRTSSSSSPCCEGGGMSRLLVLRCRARRWPSRSRRCRAGHLVGGRAREPGHVHRSATSCSASPSRR